jgi:hypothetical protein
MPPWDACRRLADVRALAQANRAVRVVLFTVESGFMTSAVVGLDGGISIGY